MTEAKKEFIYKGEPVFPKIPDLSTVNDNFSATDRHLARLNIRSDAEMVDLIKKLTHVPTGKGRTDYYIKLSELYMNAYDEHLQDHATLLTLNGVIVEMYSDILIFEEKKGETEKSKWQKERIAIIQNCVNLLKKYFVKYEESKIIVLNTHKAYAAVEAENRKLKKQLADIKAAENWNHAK